MIVEKNIYYHTEAVKVPTGVLGINTVKVAVPQSFNQIIGFGIAIESDGGQPHFKVGLRKNGNDLIHQVHNLLTKIDSGVMPKEKLLPINFLVEDGNNLYVVLEITQALTSDLKMDVVFKCIDPNYLKRLEQNTPIAYPASEGDQGKPVNMADVHTSPY